MESRTSSPKAAQAHRKSRFPIYNWNCCLLGTGSKSEETPKQYSLDIGRPSHGSHWGFSESAGAEAQTFLPILPIGCLLGTGSKSEETPKQYPLDIGRPSHGSHWGFSESAGAEAQTFLPILRHGSSHALIQSPLTDQSLAYSYVPLHANSLGLESFAVSASLTRSARARPLTALRSTRASYGAGRLASRRGTEPSRTRRAAWFRARRPASASARGRAGCGVPDKAAGRRPRRHKSPPSS